MKYEIELSEFSSLENTYDFDIYEEYETNYKEICNIIGYVRCNLDEFQEALYDNLKNMIEWELLSMETEIKYKFTKNDIEFGATGNYKVENDKVYFEIS